MKSLILSKLEGENAALKKSLKAAARHEAKLVEQLETARKVRRWTPPRAKKAVKSARDIVRVIIADTHGCKADKPALQALFSDLKSLDPDEIILMGDHVDCGGFLAQHHTLGYVAETDYTYEEDIAAASSFLDCLQKYAPRASIDYLEGNHEARVEKWAVTETLRNGRDAELIRRAVAPSTLLRLEERGIPYYRRSESYGDCRVPGWIRKGKCFFTHEISSATNAARAAVLATGGNVVYGHTHRADFAIVNFPNVGLSAAWCPGCLCTLQPLWRHTRPTNWTHGYGVQLVSPNGNFLHINVPIHNGRSLLVAMMNRS